MQKVLRFRNGAKEDSGDLALLLDVAGRGLPAYLWSIEAKQGQSAYEYGREKIRSDENRRSYHKNWYVAEKNGILVGAFFGFIVETPYPEIDYNDIPKYLHDGVIDIAIIGENTLYEKAYQFEVLERLGFSKCRVCIAVPNDFKYKDKSDLNSIRIATSYPNTLKRFLFIFLKKPLMKRLQLN